METCAGGPYNIHYNFADGNDDTPNNNYLIVIISYYVSVTGEIRFPIVVACNSSRAKISAVSFRRSVFDRIRSTNDSELCERLALYVKRHIFLI